MQSIFKYIVVFSLLLVLSCDDSDSPSPPSITFKIDTAEFNGSALSPLPSYQLTLEFDETGKPASFNSTSNGVLLPNLGKEGNWSLAGNKLKFTSGNDVSEVSIDKATVNTETVEFTMSWSLGKTDVEDAEQIGDYSYKVTKVDD